LEAGQVWRDRIRRDQPGLWGGRAVAERAMWAVAIVVIPPAPDEDLSFFEGGEDLAVKEFVPEFAVKRLDVAVLPGAARFDKEGVDLQVFKPTLDSLSAELGTVVTTNVRGGASSEK
jgi:hypothetical protein